MRHCFRILWSVALCFLLAAGGLGATEVELQPFGPDGQDSWKQTFTAPGGLAGLFKPGPLYVRIVYLDHGEGILQVTYPSAKGRTFSQSHTRSSRTDTGDWMTSYHELPDPAPAAAGDARWLGVQIAGDAGTPLQIRRVTLQDQPFLDADFQEILRAPWRQPLRFAPPAEPPGPTLKGRVMVGYQGWFRTANDHDDNGWRHWFRTSGQPDPRFYTVDMWPDTNAYPQADRVRAGDIRTRAGQEATLFSSTSESVVRQHFAWMRQHSIDGAFLQRFLTGRQGGDDGTPEWVLLNVRRAAYAEKRLWAVEYDVSGMSPETAYETLARDWRWLKNVLKVTADPYYAREGGKPVVFIWGLPVPDRNFTPAVADRIVGLFHDDPDLGGNYVLGSLSNEWPSLSPEWIAHAKRYDGLQVWQTHDYAEDKRACDDWHLDYYPHVWPGFSWAHLTRKQEPAAFTPRAGGAYYRNRVAQALDAGCDRLFIGMFDEYDEGTAIMPMSDDPPLPNPAAGRFLTNEGAPLDLWLRLTGAAREALAAPSPAQTFREATERMVVEPAKPAAQPSVTDETKALP